MRLISSHCHFQFYKKWHSRPTTTQRDHWNAVSAGDDSSTRPASATIWNLTTRKQSKSCWTWKKPRFEHKSNKKSARNWWTSSAQDRSISLSAFLLSLPIFNQLLKKNCFFHWRYFSLQIKYSRKIYFHLVFISKHKLFVRWYSLFGHFGKFLGGVATRWRRQRGGATRSMAPFMPRF